MGFLICPSPQILDHSFPRTEDDLEVIAISLGHIIGKLEEKILALLHTNTLDDFISSYHPDWNQYPMLRDVWVALNQLISHPSQESISEDLLQVENYVPHIVPQKSSYKKDSESLLELWMDELGKILILHDQCIEKDEYFIGIACPYGFSGGDVDTYQSPAIERYFPLVGEKTFETVLDDAYEWVIPLDIARKTPCIKHLTSSVLEILGASGMEQGGKHKHVIFSDVSVPFRNHGNPNEELKDYFFDGLIKAKVIREKGYTQSVLKYILTEGKLPERRCKLKRLESKK